MSHGLGLSPFLDGRAESRATGKFACDQDLAQAHAGGRSASEIEKLNRRSLGRFRFKFKLCRGGLDSGSARGAQVGTLPQLCRQC